MKLMNECDIYFLDAVVFYKKNPTQKSTNYENLTKKTFCLNRL